VTVLDALGVPLDAPIPVRIQIMDNSNEVLWETRTSAPASAQFQAPVNTQGDLRVTAVELVTGQRFTVDVGNAAEPRPIDLFTGKVPTGTGPVLPVAPPADPPAWIPAGNRLGTHVREVVPTENGLVLTAANWDSNLFFVDSAGAAVRQLRVGQGFTFGAKAVPGGVVVRGMLLDSPHGYALYWVDLSGTIQHRFDLYGVAQRWFTRITSNRADTRPPAFETAPDGHWVAAAGNLGLAVWRQDGTLLWQEDWWPSLPLTDYPGEPADTVLTALGADTLLVISRGAAACYQVSTHTVTWRTDLSARTTTVGGWATSAVPNPAGTIVAMATTCDSGTVFLLNTADGSVAAQLPAVADELVWSADGMSLVTADDSRIDQYRDTGGWALVRSYPAPDVVHRLDVAADGRIACGDEQGNLIVLDANLAPLHVADAGAIPIPRWTAQGDLITVTWTGQASQLSGTTYTPIWSSLVTSQAPDMRGNLLAPDTAPVSAITGWGNATAVPNPLPANVLPTASTTTFVIRDSVSAPLTGLIATGAGSAPPAAPLLPETYVEGTAEGQDLYSVPPSYLDIQLPAGQPVTFGSLTLWDDPAHPESWLRVLRLDVRYVRSGVIGEWQPVAWLLSDAASHTHALPPAAATRTTPVAELRLVVPPGIYGNLRLAGLACHAS
jgi:hypothetical protein